MIQNTALKASVSVEVDLFATSFESFDSGGFNGIKMIWSSLNRLLYGECRTPVLPMISLFLFEFHFSL